MLGGPVVFCHLLAQGYRFCLALDAIGFPCPPPHQVAWSEVIARNPLNACICEVTFYFKMANAYRTCKNWRRENLRSSKFWPSGNLHRTWYLRPFCKWSPDFIHGSLILIKQTDFSHPYYRVRPPPPLSLTVGNPFPHNWLGFVYLVCIPCFAFRVGTPIGQSPPTAPSHNIIYIYIFLNLWIKSWDLWICEDRRVRSRASNRVITIFSDTLWTAHRHTRIPYGRDVEFASEAGGSDAMGKHEGEHRGGHKRTQSAKRGSLSTPQKQLHYRPLWSPLWRIHHSKMSQVIEILTQKKFKRSNQQKTQSELFPTQKPIALCIIIITLCIICNLRFDLTHSDKNCRISICAYDFNEWPQDTEKFWLPFSGLGATFRGDATFIAQGDGCLGKQGFYLKNKRACKQQMPCQRNRWISTAEFWSIKHCVQRREEETQPPPFCDAEAKLEPFTIN